MKRNLVLLVCLLAGSSTMAEARQVSFGSRIGINSATFGGDDAKSAHVSRRGGLVTGVLLRIPLVARISLQPELHYSQRGADISERGTLQVRRIQVDYIEMPVLLRYAAPLADLAVRNTFFAGPTFAVEASCKFAFGLFNAPVTSNCDERDEFDRNKLDVGIAFGSGLDFPTAFGSLLVDARYTHGLRAIDNDPQDPADLKHRVRSISAGIAIPVGGR